MCLTYKNPSLHSYAASRTADSIDSSLESLESLFFIFNLFFKSLLSEGSSLVCSLRRHSPLFQTCLTVGASSPYAAVFAPTVWVLFVMDAVVLTLHISLKQVRS